MAHRSPRELIELYWERVYNAGEAELVREICANPIIRHDPGCVLPLSHDEQIERIERSLLIKPLFTHQVLHADDRFVTSVWNMVSRDGREVALCGIEVFEAEAGRFIRCWNSAYMKGLWGEDGDLFDPAALPPPSLIAAPGEITADWLQRALAAGGVASVQRLALEPEVTPVGHGTTSIVVRVRAAYNSGQITAPRSAICKIGAQADHSPERPGPFERERRAYALFGPEPGFRVPQCWFGATDAQGLTNLLIEDLTESTTAGDQITGCSPADAALTIRELALFHRRWLGRTGDVEPGLLLAPEQLLFAYAKGAGVLREWLAGPIPENELAIIDAFGRLAPTWLAQRPRHTSLIHGDPRVDNVLFEGQGETRRACIIDWQSLGTGDPQYDVAYFLSGSVSPEDRRACEQELVAEHAAMLAEADPTYSADQALEAYRRNIVSGPWMTVVAAAFIARNAHNAGLLTTLVARNTAAIADWDGLAAIG